MLEIQRNRPLVAVNSAEIGRCILLGGFPNPILCWCSPEPSVVLSPSASGSNEMLEAYPSFWIFHLENIRPIVRKNLCAKGALLS